MSALVVAIDSKGAAGMPSLEDVSNTLDERLTQLEAMSVIITGDAHDEFSRWSDEIQNNYLWSLYERIKELRSLWECQQKLLISDRSKGKV